METNKNEFPSHEAIREDEVMPGGFYNPKGLEVKVGKHVEEIFEKSRDNPELIEYSVALLKDMVDGFRQMAKQVSGVFKEKADGIQGYIDILERKKEK